MKEDVLILHNTVEEEITASGRKFWDESNAGVLEEVKAVSAALEKLGIACEVKCVRSIRQLPHILNQSRQKIVFNLVEEVPESIFDACYVPIICQLHGKACTGNSTPAMLLGQNKWHTKALLKTMNLPCAEGTVVMPGEKVCQDDLPPGKYIVKPALCDASEGIDADSVVEIPGKRVDELVLVIHHEFQQPALVEQFIPQRELNISIFERDDELHVLPLAEIDFSAFFEGQTKIVDYSAKWVKDSFAYNNTPHIIPAPLREETAQLVRRYTKEAWRALGCNGYARVDFRLDDEERPFIIEINPNPDISLDAGFAAALKAAGISYESFIASLLKEAMRRLQTPAMNK